jgi:hypothetical protein
MHFLPKDQISAATRSRLDKISSQQSVFRLSFAQNQFRYLQVAKFCAAIMPTGNISLLITDYGIFPSSENRFLYNRLRISYGNYEDLSETPLHVFEEIERAEILTYAQIAFINIWGGICFSHETLFFQFSHDEFVDFFVNDADIDKFGQKIADFGLSGEYL